MYITLVAVFTLQNCKYTYRVFTSIFTNTYIIIVFTSMTVNTLSRTDCILGVCVTVIEAGIQHKHLVVAPLGAAS